jgi:hypothetical protein
MKSTVDWSTMLIAETEQKICLSSKAGFDKINMLRLDSYKMTLFL